MALGDRHGIVVQRAAGDTARLYTLINTKDEQFATTHALREKSAAEAKTIVLEAEDAAFKDFGPVLRELITAACDDETAAEEAMLEADTSDAALDGDRQAVKLP